MVTSYRMSNGFTLGDLRNYKFDDDKNLGMVLDKTILKVCNLEYSIDSRNSSTIGTFISLNRPHLFETYSTYTSDAFKVGEFLKLTSNFKSKTPLYLWEKSALYILSMWKTHEWVIFGDYSTIDLPKLPEWVK